MVDAPEKIWIEQDDCPYFYEESELTEVGSPVTEYTRADLVAELEALAERLKHEAVLHAQEARTANATIAEIYREVSGGKGEPGNWNGAEPVRAELTALRARVAELEAALRRHTVRILTMPGETGDAIRGWSCSECNPGWFDSEDTIAHRDNCVFAAPKGGSHEQESRCQ